MKKLQRIQRILNGQTPDRPAYSFWTHFPGQDLSAATLADATCALYRELDLDFIKSMPNGMFSVQDWGCECDFSKIAHGGVARITRPAVESIQDWAHLEKPDVETGTMGRELKSLNLLLKKLNGEAPVVATVFSPMTTAHKLSKGKVLDHLKINPHAVNQCLRMVTDVTCSFAKKAIELGCAGVFLATQMCSADMMAAEDYAKFAKPLDLAVLEAVKYEAWLNILHAHGNRIYADLLADYPVQGMSWHVWETPPAPDVFLKSTSEKIIVGGIQRMSISQSRMDAVCGDIENMLRLTKGKRVILAPGCTIRHPCRPSVLKKIVNHIRNWRGFH
jgi:uroporphyrinogen decarboxylase